MSRKKTKTPGPARPRRLDFLGIISLKRQGAWAMFDQFKSRRQIVYRLANGNPIPSGHVIQEEDEIQIKSTFEMTDDEIECYLNDEDTARGIKRPGEKPYLIEGATRFLRVVAPEISGRWITIKEFDERIEEFNS